MTTTNRPIALKLKPVVEAEARRAQLPDAIQRAIFVEQDKVAVQRLSDAAYYSVVNIGTDKATYGDLFATDQSIAEGVSNLDGGKPPAGEYMLVTAIQLLHSAGASPLTQTFAAIPEVMVNGDIEIKQRGRAILPEQPCQVFKTTHQETTKVGYIEIAPVWLIPQENIEVNIKCASANAANTCVKILLIGAKNIKV